MLEKFDSVLGLGIAEMKEKKIVVPLAVKKLVAERENARAVRDWARADEIRAVLAKKGFDIEDGADGPKIVKK